MPIISCEHVLVFYIVEVLVAQREIINQSIVKYNSSSVAFFVMLVFPYHYVINYFSVCWFVHLRNFTAVKCIN